MQEPSSQSIAVAFLSEWNATRLGIQPMGWAIRCSDTPWVRFHALPKSKRYADCDSERSTILCRANRLGNELLGLGQQCWVVEARADGIDGKGAFVGSHNDGPDEPHWRYFARLEVWEQGKFDSELAEIANDGPYYIVWINRQNGNILAPYDGGFDLFPTSEKHVQELRKAHAEWLSDREDGL